MKISSLKTLAFGFTMAIMASSTGVFADHLFNDFFSGDSYDSSDRFENRRHRREIHRLIDRVKEDLMIVFESLNNIYTYEGAVPNPNPNTNPAVAGLLVTDIARINAAGEDFLGALRDLGIRGEAFDVISDQAEDFIEEALDYALAVNLANTNQPAPNQIVEAFEFVDAARALGLSLAVVTKDPGLSTFLTDIAILSTQDVQAYRLVLNGNNGFGATPANPASETAAAVVINNQIQELAELFARRLVLDLAD